MTNRILLGQFILVFFFVTLSLCVYLFEASLVCRLFYAANGLLTDIKAFIIATAVAIHVYTKFQG